MEISLKFLSFKIFFVICNSKWLISEIMKI